MAYRLLAACFLLGMQSILALGGFDTECKLTQNGPDKPMPSLTQCYKYNTESCCTAGHDHHIHTEYKDLLCPTCVREFPLLENYYCLGCNPEQNKFVDSDNSGNPVIRICKSYADMLFDESNSRLQYAKCGLNLYVTNPLITAGNPAASWDMKFEANAAARQVVLPNIVFNNATEMLNTMKPPFFEAYTIVVVNDEDYTAADGPLCFSSATRLTVPFTIMLSYALYYISSKLY